jgi:Lon protease-like protein
VVVAQGLQRFTLKHARELPHGLWVAEAQVLADDAHVPLPDELTDLGVRLRSVMKAMAADDGDTLTTLPAPEAACWQDAGWVANRWAERLPLPAPERQRLMSLDNPLWRLELVAEWLEQVIKTQGTGQARG